MPCDLDFNGKRILVTAGTKGVGKAVVGLFKQLGATVLTTARHASAECRADAFVTADLTTVKGCNSVAEAVQTHLGGVDIIVHVAGGSTAPGGGFAALGEEEWQQELNLNLLPAVRLDRALLPAMLQQGRSDHPCHFYPARTALTRINHGLCSSESGAVSLQ